MVDWKHIYKVNNIHPMYKTLQYKRWEPRVGAEELIGADRDHKLHPLKPNLSIFPFRWWGRDPAT